MEDYNSMLGKECNSIVTSKASDNLKQLEELWDSINCVKSDDISENKNGKSRVSPTPRSSSQSPVTSVSENSNDSISSSGSCLKRDISKTQLNANGSSRQVKKTKINDSIKNSKTIKIKPNNNSNNIDMLDEFTCTICKQFNQELNNKLVECRKCTNLYHQLCHVPKIRNNEIDDKDFEECYSCKNDSNSDDNEITAINTKSAIRSDVKSPNSSLSPVFNKNNDYTMDKNTSKKEINGNGEQADGKLDSYNNQNINVTNNHSSNANSHESVFFKSSGSVKGFASLATKFNGAQKDKRPKTPTQSTEKIKSSELFNLNKKKTSSTSTNKLKINSVPLANNNNSTHKNSGLFNLSNGNQKAGFNGLKDKKIMTNAMGKLDVQRSKIS